jgi:hypothetical protein
MFLAFTAFVIKTTVNEYSISNLYMFFVVSVGLLKLISNKGSQEDLNIEA